MPYEILKSQEDVEQFKLWGKPDESGNFKRTKDLDPAEKTFALLMVAMGYHVQHSTSSQDKFEHWDWKVIDYQNNKYTLVDVKGAKKEFQKDIDYNYNLCYNELQNVRGDNGWLKGKSHKIALVLINPEGFDPNAPNKVLCFYREGVLKWTESKTKDKEITDKNLRDVYYELYQRSKWGRKDICVKCEISEMKKDLPYSEYSLDVAS